jgi:hypothetical protein
MQFIDGHLRSIAVSIENHFGVEFIATSLYRIGDDGVHGTIPVRGLDLRCKDQEFGDLVAEFVNAKWEYDPQRPQKVCCKCHKTKGGALHLHLQTHPNTIRRYY